MACKGTSLPDDAPQLDWSRSLVAATAGHVTDVAASSDGRLVLGGRYEGSVELQGHADSLVSAGGADGLVGMYASDGQARWVRGFGGPGEDTVTAVAVTDEAVFIAGVFEGTVDFDGIEVTADSASDGFVARLDREGRALWVVRAGGGALVEATDLEVNEGSVVVTLNATVGPFAVGDSQPIPATGTDAHVVALDAETGAVGWLSRLTGAGVLRMASLSLDDEGNVYTVGHYAGTATALGTITRETLATADGVHAFVASWSPNGDLRWTRTWGGSASTRADAVVITDDGELVVAGRFSGVGEFAGERLDGAGTDLFVWTLDRNGQPLWLEHVRSTGTLTEPRLAVGGSGAFVLGHGTDALTTYASNSSAPVELAVEPPGAVLVAYRVDGDVAEVFPLPVGRAVTGVAGSGGRLYLGVPDTVGVVSGLAD